jgi:hypothetical protein
MSRTSLKTAPRLEAHLQSTVQWRPTGNVDRPWSAKVGGVCWELQVKDFPAEQMYTLWINGERVGSFDDWPKKWKRESPVRAEQTRKPALSSGLAKH